MCILVGKWFPDVGWVGVKNRDRNYIPEISFRKKTVDGQEILYFWDDITKYTEGLNSSGIGILSASLAVLDDEKEIDKRSKTPSKDGIKIRRALGHKDVESALECLVKDKLPGNTLIFSKDRMMLLEGSWKPGGYETKDYAYKFREIPRDETVCRTNHGVLLDWAGYQRGNGESETMSRISSESRKLIADYAANHAQTPEEIMDLLTQDYCNNGQLNALRTTTSQKKMRTTSQILIVPEKRTMFVRPVQSHIHYNFWSLNHPQQRTWVEILSNRELYHNQQNVDGLDKPPFQHNLKHSQ